MDSTENVTLFEGVTRLWGSSGITNTLTNCINNLDTDFTNALYYILSASDETLRNAKHNLLVGTTICSWCFANKFSPELRTHFTPVYVDGTYSLGRVSCCSTDFIKMDDPRPPKFFTHVGKLVNVLVKPVSLEELNVICDVTADITATPTTPAIITPATTICCLDNKLSNDFDFVDVTSGEDGSFRIVTPHMFARVVINVFSPTYADPDNDQYVTYGLTTKTTGLFNKQFYFHRGNNNMISVCRSYSSKDGVFFGAVDKSVFDSVFTELNREAMMSRHKFDPKNISNQFTLRLFSTKSTPNVHCGITCDNCREHHITGIRYMCMKCNFDLCENCIEYTGHEHELTPTLRNIHMTRPAVKNAGGENNNKWFVTEISFAPPKYHFVNDVSDDGLKIVNRSMMSPSLKSFECKFTLTSTLTPSEIREEFKKFKMIFLTTESFGWMFGISCVMPDIGKGMGEGQRNEFERALNNSVSGMCLSSMLGVNGLCELKDELVE